MEADDFAIRSSKTNGALVLSLGYPSSQLFEVGVATNLAKALVEAYRSAALPPQTRCVLVIEAEVAGSPIVRAIFELYQVVRANGGDLVVVGYPEAYLTSLTGLGLPALAGFSMARDISSAMEPGKA